jgi:hypothetical protein
MRKLGRWALRSLAGLSLLVCVAAMLLFVLSYFSAAVVQWVTPTGLTGNCVISRGGVAVSWFRQHPVGSFDWKHRIGAPGAVLLAGDSAELDQRNGGELVQLPGLAYRVVRGNPDTAVAVRLWLVAIAGALLPLSAAIRSSRKRRASKSGCCRRCGYDLRATPDVCPECGTPVERLVQPK